MRQPIFILSSARSGSTLLRYVLDTHPAVYAPPELDLGALADALAVTHAGLHGQRPSVPPLGSLSAEVRAGVLDHISGMMDEQLRRRGKAIWCEKAPPNMSHLDLLTDLYPEARYVCLYRNHLDTIHSCLESSRYVFLPPLREHLARNPESLLRATIEYWLDVTAKLIALERSRRYRTYRLRYEDMVRHPGKALAGLFSYLGLAWDPGLLDAVFTTPHDTGQGDLFVPFHDRINADSIGRGRAIPAWPLADDRRTRAEELNRELGYLELVEQIQAAPAPAPPPAAASQAGDAPPQPAGRGLRWLFEEHLPARLKARPEALPLHGRSFRFVLSGEEGGCWLLHHDANGGCEILEGQAAAAAEATTLSLSGADLLGVVEGRLQVVTLQRSGRIAISGLPPSLEQIQSLVNLLRSEA